ncbi:hypothetical protein ACWD46_31975 [Streptomyces sp. NPDC002486]
MRTGSRQGRSGAVLSIMATSDAYVLKSRTGRCQSEQKTGVAAGSGADEVGARGRRHGALTDDQLPELVDMVLDPEGKPLVTYLGYAVRRA